MGHEVQHPHGGDERLPGAGPQVDDGVPLPAFLQQFVLDKEKGRRGNTKEEVAQKRMAYLIISEFHVFLV